MEFVKEFNRLNIIVKLVLTFFFDPILGAVYRIARGNLLWGILWFVTAGFFGIGWLIDLITVLMHNKYTVLV